MSNVQKNPQSVLLPIFDNGVISTAGALDAISPDDYLAANPRVDCSLTITVGGTITNGDELKATFTCGTLPGGALQVTSGALTGGDTLETAADKLAKAINDSAILENAGIRADVADVDVQVKWNGPVGLHAVISTTVTGAATETLTRNPVTGKPAGGSGPIIPSANFQYAFNGNILDFRAGMPQIVDDVLLAALVLDGQPIY